MLKNITSLTCLPVQLCDTYPKYLYVPASATTTILLGSSKFRSKGRLPVLSYLHKNKVNFSNLLSIFCSLQNYSFLLFLIIMQAVICRCSQPLSGFSARCVEDEQLLNCILQSNPNCNFMYVVDTRPMVSCRFHFSKVKSNASSFKLLVMLFALCLELNIVRVHFSRLMLWLTERLVKDMKIKTSMKISNFNFSELKTYTLCVGV